MPFFDFDQIDYKIKRKNVSIKSITGEKSQLCIIRMEAGEKTFHQHAEEQIGLILNGKVEMTIGDEKKILKANHGYYIPSGIAHGFNVHGQEGVEYIEIFTPPKENNNI